MNGPTDVRWVRRLMRRPGSLASDRQLVPKMWHIQGPGAGTYCGANIERYLSEPVQAPYYVPPDGDLCPKCDRQYLAGEVLPLRGGSSWRKG